MRVFILGATGLLGKAFISTQQPRNWQIYYHSRTGEDCHAVDLTDKEQAISLFNQYSPDLIINFVALTNVDWCELYPNEAYKVNVKIIENAAYWIRHSKKNVRFVQISTDQVYDGVGPHIESGVCLKNYYAFSKYCGELSALSIDDSLVLRTNFFGRSINKNRKSFSDWLFDALVEEREIKVFHDVFFSPISMNKLCDLIVLAAESDVIGTYNLGSYGGMSKADFAYFFAHQLGLDSSRLIRASVEEMSSLKAYRPRDMRLNCNLFEKCFGVNLPELKQEIISISKDYVK